MNYDVYDAIWALSAHLALLSLIAIGGVQVVLPDLHRYIVEEQHWMSGAQFSALFALGQAAPGPNVLVVTLFGYQIAGIAGALAATVAICLPSSLLTYAVMRVGQRWGETQWKTIAKAGLAPLTIGVVIASGYVLAQSASAGILGYAITAVTALIAATTRWNPLWLLAAAGVIGAIAL